jgi:hypothetical protein
MRLVGIIGWYLGANFGNSYDLLVWKIIVVVARIIALHIIIIDQRWN